MKVSEGIFDTEKSNKSSEPSHAVIMPPNTRCRTWCGVAAIVLHTQLCVYLENIGRQGILVSY
jgi:hypothetical protein